MSAKVGASGGELGLGAVTASSMNSYRFGLLMERLTHIFRSCPRSDSFNGEMFDICIHLAKGIDYAVSHNEVPSTARDLPSLIKQVYEHRTDPVLQSIIMLLMLSVKNACRNGWFQATDNDDLLILADEISSIFCDATVITLQPNNALQIISKIISRFYPQMKMGQIIISFEAKPGYEVLVFDFLINKSMVAATPQERIRLFVAQTDNIETSSCIITPQEVTFMLNGKGVERRTNVSMDGGPQLPTDVTTMLKYGTNLIQVIGKFNGNYIIIIAYASVVSPSSFNTDTLQDHVQPVTESVSDAEIIEGPSRISLNCPISYKRIKTPVKGQFCRHHQSFDCYNFMEINSRKPSWRCPHCNQPVCFNDLRVDQNIVRVLKEAGEDVVDVLISADGCWKVVDEHDLTNKLQSGLINSQQDGLEQTESKRSQDALANVVDLTMGRKGDGDIAIDSTGARVLRDFTDQRNFSNTTCETEDWKPFQDIQLFSAAGNLPEAPSFCCTSERFQEPAGQMGQGIGSWISSSASALNGSLAHSAAASGVDALVGLSESFPLDELPPPVLADAFSPALSREPGNVHRATQPMTTLQNVAQLPQFVAPENLQLQQSRFENSIISNETLRRSITRNISRTPVAVQALPAQTQLPDAHQRRPRPNAVASCPIFSNGATVVASQISPFMTATSDGFSTASSEMERQQLSRPQISPLSVSDFTSSQLHTMSQARDTQHAPNELLPQVVALPPTNLVGSRMPSDQQLVNAYRSSFGPLPLDHQNPHTQFAQNQRVSQTILQPQNLIHQPSNYASLHAQRPAQPVIGLAAGSSSSLHTQPKVSLHSSSQMMRTPGIASQLQASRAIPSFAMNASDFNQSFGEQIWNPISDSLIELPLEDNWRQRVTGRMRGSLTGQSYSAALSQLTAQPTVPAQIRPPLMATVTPSPTTVSLLANSVNAHVSKPGG